MFDEFTISWFDKCVCASTNYVISVLSWSHLDDSTHVVCVWALYMGRVWWLIYYRSIGDQRKCPSPLCSCCLEASNPAGWAPRWVCVPHNHAHPIEKRLLWGKDAHTHPYPIPITKPADWIHLNVKTMNRSHTHTHMHSIPLPLLNKGVSAVGGLPIWTALTLDDILSALMCVWENNE